MTERLTELLTAEVDGLDIPAPPAGAVLARGKGVRRRRRLAVGAAAIAAAAVVGGAATLATGGGSGAAPDPAGAPAPMTGPAFTLDTTLYYGRDGAGLRTAEIDDKAVKSIFYTSAGVVVRHGDSSASDGGGPQRFSLVRADGSVTGLGLVTAGAVHATDAAEPYVVYGENVDGRLEVVVYDVLADAVAQRVVVGDTDDSWFPVSLDGDTVFVQNGHGDGVYAVQWRSGEVERSDVVDGVWAMNGGRAGSTTDDRPTVIDVRTGEVLLTGPAGRSAYFEVSPDGRYAGLVDEEGEEGGETTEFVVYDIESGGSHTFDGYVYDWGWTPDGDLFKVGPDTVTTCDTATGACTATAADLPDGTGSAPPGAACAVVPGADQMRCPEPEGPVPPEIRLGGRTYES